MVDELEFEDNSSPWEHHIRDPKDYIQWVEEKKGDKRIRYSPVTGTGVEYLDGQVVPPKVRQKATEEDTDGAR